MVTFSYYLNMVSMRTIALIGFGTLFSCPQVEAAALNKREDSKARAIYKAAQLELETSKKSTTTQKTKKENRRVLQPLFTTISVKESSALKPKSTSGKKEIASLTHELTRVRAQYVDEQRKNAECIAQLQREQQKHEECAQKLQSAQELNKEIERLRPSFDIEQAAPIEVGIPMLNNNGKREISTDQLPVDDKGEEVLNEFKKSFETAIVAREDSIERYKGKIKRLQYTIDNLIEAIKEERLHKVERLRINVQQVMGQI